MIKAQKSLIKIFYVLFKRIYFKKFLLFNFYNSYYFYNNNILKNIIKYFFGGLIKFDEDTFTLYSTNFDSFNSRLNNGFSMNL
jgi:hypothetical protein